MNMHQFILEILTVICTLSVCSFFKCFIIMPVRTVFESYYKEEYIIYIRIEICRKLF